MRQHHPLGGFALAEPDEAARVADRQEAINRTQFYVQKEFKNWAPCMLLCRRDTFFDATQGWSPHRAFADPRSTLLVAESPSCISGVASL